MLKPPFRTSKLRCLLCMAPDTNAGLEQNPIHIAVIMHGCRPPLMSSTHATAVIVPGQQRQQSAKCVCRHPGDGSADTT